MAHGTDGADGLHQAGVCRNMGHAYEPGVVVANQFRHGLHVDPAFDSVWRSQDPYAMRAWRERNCI